MTNEKGQGSGLEYLDLSETTGEDGRAALENFPPEKVELIRNALP